MSEQLVRLLAICALMLIYLFFLRVLRAVWADVAIPRGQLNWRSILASRGAQNENIKASSQPQALVVRSPLHAQGERHLLNDVLTIGRSADCDVVIDDRYSSQAHARLSCQGDQHVVEDLGSTNGTYLNRQKVDATTVVRVGDYVQIGSTVFEVTP